MGKLKTLTTLLKINNKLGLLDLGDMIGLASTAYKVKTFDPTDHLPDFNLDFWEREEIEKEQRRNAILAAAVIGTGAYLIAKNRDKIADAANDARSKTKELASDVSKKGEEIAHDAKEKVEDLADDAEDKLNQGKKSIEAKEVKNSFYDNY